MDFLEIWRVVLRLVTLNEYVIALLLHLTVILQDGSVPVKYGLSMDMEARFSAIKTSLSKLCNVPSSNLTLVEVVQSQLRVSTTVEDNLLYLLEIKIEICRCLRMRSRS